MILHVDMDAFFAAVAQLDDPNLRGKPVLVGGTGPRGVVSTASYEARAHGCRSAMPMSTALRLCPQAIVVRGNSARYKQLSDTVMQILESYSPIVERVGIDEAYVDATGSVALFGSPKQIGQAIRAQIKQQTQLTASVGIGPNTLVAKIASDLNKPDALTIIEPHQVADILGPLPIKRIPGVGPAAQQALEKLGVRTIAQLRDIPLRTLEQAIGSWATNLHERAWGRSTREVTTERDQAKSVGQEHTFAQDVFDRDELLAVLRAQCEQVGRRLRKKSLLAGGLTIKIRYGDFQTLTRHTPFPAEHRPTDRSAVLFTAARDLFNTWADANFRPVRLIGVSAREITPKGSEQLALFADADPTADRKAKAEQAADSIAARFGPAAITPASALKANTKRHSHGFE